MEPSTATLEPELMPGYEPPMPTEPDGLYEVVNGQVVEKPEMGAYQAWVATELFKLIIESGIHFEGQFLSEMLFLLDRDAGLKRRPDLAFVSYERWPRKRRIPKKDAWDVVPDLAIEVISPSNLASDMIVKIRDYFRTGVNRVWVFYPIEEQVYVYDSPTSVRILTRADRLEEPTILPGFSLSLAELFESGEEEAE